MFAPCRCFGGLVLRWHAGWAVWLWVDVNLAREFVGDADPVGQGVANPDFEIFRQGFGCVPKGCQFAHPSIADVFIRQIDLFRAAFGARGRAGFLHPRIGRSGQDVGVVFHM